MELSISSGIFFTVLACMLIVKLIKACTLNREKRFKYPPGPWGFPILGYMPLLALSPQERLESLSKKYGAIYTIHLGSYR